VTGFAGSLRQASHAAIRTPGGAERQPKRAPVFKPKVWFIPAQANGLGSSCGGYVSAEGALHCHSTHPAWNPRHTSHRTKACCGRQSGGWPGWETTAWRDAMRQAFSLQPLIWGDEPRPLAWAGMKQAFGLVRGFNARSFASGNSLPSPLLQPRNSSGCRRRGKNPPVH